MKTYPAIVVYAIHLLKSILYDRSNVSAVLITRFKIRNRCARNMVVNTLKLKKLFELQGKS